MPSVVPPDAPRPPSDAGEYALLSRRAQLARLRRMARRALASYGVDEARLTLQRHEHNTTFRVLTRGGSYLLRINRPAVHTRDAVESEMTWLRALGRDDELLVPEPVPARDGSFVVVARDPGVPEPRACVLLRWLDGRFLNRSLAPKHLARIGTLAARLQERAQCWEPPPAFVRPRVDTLTSVAKVESLAGSQVHELSGDHPTRQDGDLALELVETLVSSAGAAALSEALEVVRGTTRALAREHGSFGLVHGDLHYENVLFQGDRACAIDFDDCGWGFWLYDLASTLWELEDRPRYTELRDALLDAYARIRPLPRECLVHLHALSVLRRLQILLWILESREHAAFRDGWQTWAREELDGIAAMV